MYCSKTKWIVESGTEFKEDCRPGISSLKGQGHFHFAKGTSIGESERQWETIEGAPRPRPGAMETMACVYCIPGLHI